MQYYENDIRPSTDNHVAPPPGGVDENTAQHMVTYSVAFGVEGNVTSMPSDATSPFAWPAPLTNDALIDDLRHAMPDIALRTSFIVGYPGETEREFRALERFVADWAQDHLDELKANVDPDTGRYEAIAHVDGFNRGLSFVGGHYALVGVSQVRESAIFSGVPITERLDPAQIERLRALGYAD